VKVRTNVLSISRVSELTFASNRYQHFPRRKDPHRELAIPRRVSHLQNCRRYRRR
jgi:hypothetical protein